MSLAVPSNDLPFPVVLQGDPCGDSSPLPAASSPECAQSSGNQTQDSLLLQQPACHGEYLMNPGEWVEIQLVEKEE